MLANDKPTIEKKLPVCLQLTKRENTIGKSLKIKKRKHEIMLSVTSNGKRTTQTFPILKGDS